jgi:cytochrome c
MRQWLSVIVIVTGISGSAFAADAPVVPVSAVSPVSPADAMNIAGKNACMGCHAVDRKIVGPSFQQIAAKYRGDAQAPVRLEAKVRDGGSGVWGVLPMPSHRSMDSADIKKVVGWILAGAPSK